MATADVDEDVYRVEVEGGRWETLGVDRFPSAQPRDLQIAGDPWGPLSATFAIDRDPLDFHPDLLGETPIEIDVGGQLGFEGYIRDTPAHEGEDGAYMVVNCDGWQAELDDDTITRRYVSTRLADFRDCRSLLTEDLAVHTTIGSVETGDGGIVLGFVKPSNPGGFTRRAGVVLDLGENQVCARLIVEWESANNEGNVYFQAQIADREPTGGLAASEYDQGTALALNGGATGIYRFTPGTARRYVQLYVLSTYNGILGTDHWFRIKRVLVAGDPAYEAGDQSALSGDVVIKDVRDRATRKISRSNDRIAAVTFKVPDFSLTDATPRKACEDINALHRYLLRIERGRVLAFQPQASRATLKLAPDVTFDDASKGSTTDVVNRCVVTGQDAAGVPVYVERYAAQQPGIPFESVASPSLANPHFDVDVLNWTAFGPVTKTRVTNPVESGAGAMSLAGGAGSQPRGVLTAFTGTFVAGTLYRIACKVRINSGAEINTFRLRVGLGTTGYVETSIGIPYPSGANLWADLIVAWMPKVTTPAEVILDSPKQAVTGYVDSFSIATAAPTVLDRRGKVRSKTLQVGVPIDNTIANLLADLYLQAHMRVPFKGTVQLPGRRGAVTDVLTERPLHNVELIWRTGEIVRHPRLVDPDTGAAGRDAYMVGVNYQADGTGIALDNTRNSIDVLLARLGVKVK